MSSYRAYHLNAKNKLTHFFGIPLVTLSVFISFGWFRFSPMDIPISSGTVLLLVSLFYYLKLHPGIGVVTSLWVFPLFIIGEEIAVSKFSLSVSLFLASFIIGMGFQLLGHYYEGKKPAFTDNFLQVFNGPLLLTTEVMGRLGFKV